MKLFTMSERAFSSSSFTGRLALRAAASSVLLAACGAEAPGDSGDLDTTDGATLDATVVPATEDGLADGFSTFLDSFTGGNFDAQYRIGYGFHFGLNTEKVVGADGATASGQATLDLNSGRVIATLDHLPPGGTYDLWFVKNVEGSGRTFAPESGDQTFKVGRFAGTGESRTLDLSIGVNVGFDLDLLVVTRGGKTPAQSRIAVGERTLFEKRLFRFRQGKSLDSVTGTLAKDIETNDPLVARGAQLFFHETFGGNGRTCGTCHRADDSLTIDPVFISKLPPNDPLFVAETNPALARLENPQLLRSRGLILENLDGFEDPTRKFVMRGVPHLLSLGLTNGIFNAFSGPPDQRLGWGGDGGPGRSDLHGFAFGAIMQHFTKTLARRPGIDFRIPTQEELDALEAFQLFVGRQKPVDFFAQFPSDLRAANGRELFLGVGCTSCHSDLFGFVDSFNSNFDTGVANLTPDLPGDDGFLSPGDGSFNVPPLAEAADTPPLFHNNSAATIEDAVAFYFSPTFQASPSGFFIFQQINAEQQGDVAAFLRVVNASSNLSQVRKRVAFVRNTRSTGNTDILTIALADARDARVVLSAEDLNPNVVKQIGSLETILRLAKTEPDNRRPPAMRRALALIDSASAALFTSTPPGGPIGEGGANGEGGRGTAGSAAGPSGGSAGFAGFGTAGAIDEGGAGGSSG